MGQYNVWSGENTLQWSLLSVREKFCVRIKKILSMDIEIIYYLDIVLDHYFDI